MMAKTASNKPIARRAGMLYLGVVLAGMLALVYIPSKLYVAADPAATFRNIAGSQPLFRVGIVSSVVCYTAFLFLPLYLYKLLKPVNANCARLMVLLVTISTAMSFINLQHQFSILSLLNGRTYLSGLSADQVRSGVLFSLAQYNNGVRMVEIFWGLWLLPFGYLVFKSGILPKVLGILLMFGCLGYLIEFFGYSLFPNHSKAWVSSYIGLPGTFGEIGTCLWLLVMGAKEYKGDGMTVEKTNRYEYGV